MCVCVCVCVVCKILQAACKGGAPVTSPDFQVGGKGRGKGLRRRGTTDIRPLALTALGKNKKKLEPAAYCSESSLQITQPTIFGKAPAL